MKFSLQLRKLNLRVSVPIADAVKRQRGVAGATLTPLTDAMLGALDTSERDLLAERLSETDPGDAPGLCVVQIADAKGYTGPLTVTDPDLAPESVVAALRRELAAIREARAALAADIAAKPAASWIDQNGCGEPSLNYRAKEFLRLPGALENPVSKALAQALADAHAAKLATDRTAYLAKTPRELVEGTWMSAPRRLRRPFATKPPVMDDETRAHLARVEEAVQDILAENDRRDAEDEAKAEAEAVKAKAVKAKAEAEAAEKAHAAKRDEASIRTFARAEPDLAKAAENGYEVASGVLDVLAVRLASTIPGPSKSEATREGSDSWRRIKPSEAKSPRPARFEQRDAVCAAVKTLARPEHGVSVQVSRVQTIRQSYDDRRDPEEFRGVIVTLDTTLGTSPRHVVVRFPG